MVDNDTFAETVRRFVVMPRMSEHASSSRMSGAAGGSQQLGAGRCDADAADACAAFQQAHAQAFLQSLDLVADRARRDVQRRCRARKPTQASRSLKGAKSSQRGKREHGVLYNAQHPMRKDLLSWDLMRVRFNRAEAEVPLALSAFTRENDCERQPAAPDC